MSIQTKTNTNKSLKNPSEIVKNIFDFSIFKKEREKDIILKRFGLLDASKMTLDSIGKNLGITRERVRQIEKNALNKITKNAELKDFLDEIEKNITNYFENNGLLFSDTEIAKVIVGKDEVTEDQKNCIFFLLTLNKELKYVKDNKLHEGVWCLKEYKTGEISETLKKVIIGLEEEGKTLSLEEIKSNLNLTLGAKTLKNILGSSKQIIISNEKYGLKNWRFINPKSIYDKIQIIFSESRKPLHYGDITMTLNNQYLAKKITQKAVHNELIKNDKFVLIGRGIYALKEWGYEEGTVEDVILAILKKEGKPLHKNEIIKRVLEKRIVKEATIIINLQKFKRVGKAVYTA